MREYFKRIGRALRGKESATARLAVTTGHGKEKWTDRRYETFAREGYMKNVIAFRCIFEIATSVSSVDWDVFEKLSDGKMELFEDHWLTSIVGKRERASPEHSFSAMLMRSVAFLVMSGDTFMERVTPQTGPNIGVVKEMYTHRPDRMKFLLKGGLVVGYAFTFTGGAQAEWSVDPITKQSDILHMKLFHPIEDFQGLSLIEPTARQIDTSNEAISWNKSLLENQGRPGLMITIVGNLSDTQFDELDRQLEDRSGGSGAGKHLIIEGERGTQAKPYNWNPAEMDWLEGNRETSRNICFGMGVPPMLLGIPGDNTYSNQREARQGFWDTTVLYYLNFYRGEFNNWLLSKEPTVYLNYNLDNIPAMEYRREKKWERAENADFLSINEKRDLAGYETWGETGDVILVDASKIPLGTEMTEEVVEGETEEEVKKRLLLEGYSQEDIDELLEDPRRLPGPNEGLGEVLEGISNTLKLLAEKETNVQVTLPEQKTPTIIVNMPKQANKDFVRDKDGFLVGLREVEEEDDVSTH